MTGKDDKTLTFAESAFMTLVAAALVVVIGIGFIGA